MSRNGETERYRKVSLRIHADDKYRRLTPPPPCGQVLWWHLIAGEQTGIIPGLMKIGEMAFAEQLGWELEGFREAFREVFREGMAKADWKVRLIWVPNALKHNMPENPNVIKKWAKEWPFIPECDLKSECYVHMLEVLKGFSISFGEAFEKAFAKPLAKDDVKTIGKQEQKQEQEQKEIPPTPQRGDGASKINGHHKIDPEPEFDLTPAGLARKWVFLRQGTGKENIVEVGEVFTGMIAQGISAAAIRDEMDSRPSQAEYLWKFRDRLEKKTKPKSPKPNLADLMSKMKGENS